MTVSTHFTFRSAELPIRDDLRAALRETWDYIARPGNWFTGAERVAIAEASREAHACDLCQRRKDSLSPASLEGRHDGTSGLPESVVDVVHKIVTDQNRITRRWVEGILGNGLLGRDAEGEYVEIVGIVVLVFSIDEFMRGIGVTLETLPQPIAGEPSCYRPPSLETETGFVPMIPPDGNTGNEADLWGDMTANVIRALSLVPDCVRQWISLSDAMYIPLRVMAQPGLETGRPFDRLQTEFVAGRVSSHNECFY